MTDPVQPAISDRIMTAFRALVRAELQPLRYAGQYDYTITAKYGAEPDQTFDCRPSDASLGLPALANVSIQREVAGMTSLPEVGFGCRIIFLNRDPGLPRVVGWNHVGKTPIVRLGDRCSINFPQQCALLAGASLSPLFHSGPFTGTLIVAEPNIDGFITVGSAKAFSG